MRGLSLREMAHLERLEAAKKPKSVVVLMAESAIRSHASHWGLDISILIDEEGLKKHPDPASVPLLLVEKFRKARDRHLESTTHVSGAKLPVYSWPGIVELGGCKAWVPVRNPGKAMQLVQNDANREARRVLPRSRRLARRGLS